MIPGVLWNMIEAFNDGVALADGEGTLVLASWRLEKIFGYERTELTGQRLDRLIPAHLQAARARPVGTGVLLTGLRKDGTTFPVEISLSPVQTVTGRFSLAVVRDMTAVRSLADLDIAAAAADQVRRSQDLLDTIITSLDEVGVSLQAAADLPRDKARPHIEEALRILDDTISQIRDSTFAEDQGHSSGPAGPEDPATLSMTRPKGADDVPPHRGPADPSGPADAAAGDAGRDDAQEQLSFPGRPGLDARPFGRRALGLGIRCGGRDPGPARPALAPRLCRSRRSRTPPCNRRP